MYEITRVSVIANTVAMGITAHPDPLLFHFR